MKKITVAIAGNPNSGKTSIFNMLTGARQHVGNYPGVTVEKKEGLCQYKDYEITVVDLPGTYSLSAYSEEELIARNFIIEEQPEVVLDVIDSSVIERNLYLATQLMEMNVPLVLAFNMSDIAERKGLQFDTGYLSELLQARIVSTVGNRVKGRANLLDAVIETARQGKVERIHRINYGDEIGTELIKIETLIADKEQQLAKKFGQRWLAIKLLEQDGNIREKIGSEEVLKYAAESIEHLKNIFGDEPEIILADRRYGFISGACQETIKSTVELRHDKSDMADAILIHRVLGLPIFLLLMYLVFMLTFRISEYPMSWLEHFFGWAGHTIANFWPAGSESWLKSLLVDGVIGGVGGVIVFLPNILLLFMSISILEDTGYMARAAFVMDRIMHKIGLHGKSFIPMLIGFGCSVPAIMGARILENRRNRLTTIMVVPLMSCGAKLTIYALIIPAFFVEKWRGPMLWLIYLIGIVLAVICIKVLRVTIFSGETTPFVMELPPYRMPTLKSVCLHMWHRGWMYLQKAGTIILAISIVLWLAGSYPKPSEGSLAGLNPEQTQQKKLEYSVIGRIGLAIEPVIKPLGFDWKIGTALIGATAAKEVFVSQLGIVYAVGNNEEGSHTLREKLQAAYSPLTGFCIMLFCMIYAPCAATVAMTKQETNSWGWALFQFFGLTALAYIVTFIVYQLGSLFAG
ncbi:MAG: ferrous iron transport protein B [Phycisphaerae bacterium]|nr:ferrous iron transport protein B [Phycisphaerae bacterium]MDD5381445.1 ferrous iron transport protein B [Phycisphaerae bacterium]